MEQLQVLNLARILFLNYIAVHIRYSPSEIFRFDLVGASTAFGYAERV